MKSLSPQPQPFWKTLLICAAFFVGFCALVSLIAGRPNQQTSSRNFLSP